MFHLYDFFLFNGLDDSQKENIINGLSSPQNFKKGETIYSANLFPDAIGIAVSDN